MKPARPVRKWLLRFVESLTALLVVGAIGFEIWRQLDIASAQEQLGVSHARIDPALPTFDEWRGANIGPSDGTPAFEGFMIECHNYGVGFPDNPADRLPLRDRKPWAHDPQPTAQELSTWLTATDHLAQAFATASDYNLIILDPRSPGLEFGDYHMSTLWLYGLINMDIPYDRVLVLHYLGRDSQALVEYRNLRRVARALRPGGSTQQLWLLALFTAHVREAALALAIDGVLPQEDLRAALEPEPDWVAVVATTARTTLARVRDDGTRVIAYEGEDARYKDAWFSWLNPGNYDDYDSQELVYNSIACGYERRGVKAWIDHTAAWIASAEAGAKLPEDPNTAFFEGRLLHWNQSVKRLRHPPAHAEMLDCVLRLRLGETPQAYLHLETERKHDTWSLAFRYNEPTWKAMFRGEPNELPLYEEFCADYPAITLKLK